MTVGQAEDFTSLHERVLTFMGAFSATQFAIDTMIGMYLRRQMPVLGEELDRQFLRRVRDEQRLPLFKAFAVQVGYTFDAIYFGRLYNRAKQVRDMVGHSHAVSGSVHGGGMPVVAVASTAANTNLVPRPLFPSTFTRLTVDCQWMHQHVSRAGYEGNAASFVNGASEPVEPPVPPARPEGGEPL